MGLPNGETWLANATRFLIEKGESEAARHLLGCTIDLREYEDWHQTHVAITLTGPKDTYDLISSKEYETSSIRTAINKAFRVFLPGDLVFGRLDATIEMSAVDPDWRIEMTDLLKGRVIDNQGVEFDQSIPVKLWMNLRFRSQSEIKIAEALDKAGVLFLPNCRARVGKGNDRKNREADFLICSDGKWGILEVDGEPFHPPSRTVHDHERDRLFKVHGVIIAEHFDSEKCRNDPDGVVKAFLDLLRRT